MNELMLGDCVDIKDILCVIQLEVLDFFNVECSQQFLESLVDCRFLLSQEVGPCDEVHNISLSPHLRNLPGVQHVEDVLLLFTPKVPVLMPIGGFLL